MTQRILFRVDANSQIGFGHLVRCISIAKSMEQFDCVFLSTENLNEFLEIELLDNISFISIEKSQDFLEKIESRDIVVLDGYQFDTGYCEQIANKAMLVSIDDLAEIKIPADIIINPTPKMNPAQYSASLHTQFLLGIRYAMLRPAFLEIAQKKILKKEQGSLFICFGGSDPLNKTKNALSAALTSNQFDAIHVVLGPGYTHQSTLNIMDEKNSNITIHNNLNESAMAELMGSTEFAILPSSGILLEGIAAKMNIISGYYVDNQKFVYESHNEMNSFIDASNLSETNILSAIDNLKSGIIQDSLIDGKSTQRIAKSIALLAKENACELVKAKDTHLSTTFEWANDPVVRQFAFNKESIPWENHLKWYLNKINSKNCWYGILESNGVALGSIRFDIVDKKAIISYLVDSKQHGNGYGTLLIKLGLKAISENFNNDEIEDVHGEVFPSNIASVKTFERFGFNKKDHKDVLLFIKKFKSNV